MIENEGIKLAYHVYQELMSLSIILLINKLSHQTCPGCIPTVDAHFQILLPQFLGLFLLVMYQYLEDKAKLCWGLLPVNLFTETSEEAKCIVHKVALPCRYHCVKHPLWLIYNSLKCNKLQNKLTNIISLKMYLVNYIQLYYRLI